MRGFFAAPPCSISSNRHIFEWLKGRLLFLKPTQPRATSNKRTGAKTSLMDCCSLCLVKRRYFDSRESYHLCRGRLSWWCRGGAKFKKLWRLMSSVMSAASLMKQNGHLTLSTDIMSTSPSSLSLHPANYIFQRTRPRQIIWLRLAIRNPKAPRARSHTRSLWDPRPRI